MIGIYGDSWGCGEWGSPSGVYHNMHRGLEQYLKDDNYQCINQSHGGGSNYRAIVELEREQYHKKINTAIFILTEPFRDFASVPSRYDENKTFFDNCIITLQDTLARLKAVQNKNTNVILVNGLHQVEKQKELHAHISFCELLYPGIRWPVYYANPGLVNEVFLRHKKIKIDKNSVINELPKDMIMQEKFFTLMDNNKLFHPDGAHPNREAHKILYNAVKGKL